uniref:NTP_transf_2 domain-containing protein n=1 Tax=Globodera pallida TaxID=36090 RepID=A0A183C2P5_GLOPA
MIEEKNDDKVNGKKKAAEGETETTGDEQKKKAKASKNRRNVEKGGKRKEEAAKRNQIGAKKEATTRKSEQFIHLKDVKTDEFLSLKYLELLSGAVDDKPNNFALLLELGTYANEIWHRVEVLEQLRVEFHFEFWPKMESLTKEWDALEREKVIIDQKDLKKKKAKEAKRKEFTKYLEQWKKAMDQLEFDEKLFGEFVDKDLIQTENSHKLALKRNFVENLQQINLTEEAKNVDNAIFEEYYNDFNREIEEKVNTELGTIRQIVDKWSNKTGKLLVGGSLQLNVYMEGSDIDTICIVPEHFGPDDFFGTQRQCELEEWPKSAENGGGSSLFCMLYKHPDVRSLRRIPFARVPIIRLVFRSSGLEFDIVFASIPGIRTLSINKKGEILNVDKLIAKLANHIKSDASARDGEINRRMLRSLAGFNSNLKLLEMAPNIDTFRKFVLVLKRWSKTLIELQTSTSAFLKGKWQSILRQRRFSEMYSEFFAIICFASDWELSEEFCGFVGTRLRNQLLIGSAECITNLCHVMAPRECPEKIVQNYKIMPTQSAAVCKSLKCWVGNGADVKKTNDERSSAEEESTESDNSQQQSAEEPPLSWHSASQKISSSSIFKRFEQLEEPNDSWPEDFYRTISICSNHTANGTKMYIKEFGNSCPPGNKVAVGRYRNAVKETGWGILEVETFEGHPPEWQAFAAGLAEGSLTKMQISDHYSNTVKGHCAKHKEYCKKLYRYLADNLEWTDAQIDANRGDLYWRHVNLTFNQLAGIFDGYGSDKDNSYTPRAIFTINPIYMIQLSGDLIDLNILFKKKPSSKDEAVGMSKSGHCSGLVKVADGNKDLLVSHVTMNGFNAMNRIIKLYKFAYDSKEVPGHTVSFSGYPAALASDDDFTLTSAGLVVDYKLFKPSQQLPESNLIWILEQIPGLTESRDVTWFLRKYNYWPSYNIPFLRRISELSGSDRKGMENDWWRWGFCPRARIFNRDQHKVQDLNSLMALMRYNDYKHDEFSRCNCTPPYTAEAGISTRDDLNPANGTYQLHEMGHRNYGSLDYKGTNSDLFKKLRFEAIGGPTYGGPGNLPAFDWGTTDIQKPHNGQPNVWRFDPFVTEWMTSVEVAGLKQTEEGYGSSTADEKNE